MNTVEPDQTAPYEQFDQVQHCLLRPASFNSSGGGRVVRWCWVNFQGWGILLIWNIVGQGPTELAAGAGRGCLDIFLSSIISLFFRPLPGRQLDIDCNTVSKSG